MYLFLYEYMNLVSSFGCRFEDFDALSCVDVVTGE